MKFSEIARSFLQLPRYFTFAQYPNRLQHLFVLDVQVFDTVWTQFMIPRSGDGRGMRPAMKARPWVCTPYVWLAHVTVTEVNKLSLSLNFLYPFRNSPIFMTTTGSNMFLKIRKRLPGSICDCSRTKHCVCSFNEIRRQFDIFAERDGCVGPHLLRRLLQVTATN